MLSRSVRCVALWLGIQSLAVLAPAATSSLGSNTTLSGEQKQWHRVTLTFTGPSTSETNSTNPFRNYRLNVTFKHSSGKTYVVPGFYAADGDAANSSATSGNKWRVHFTPDATGTWNYTASFRTGTDVAISLSSTAGSPTSFDGTKGSFTVDATNKSGADFRGKGRLIEVGQHYLQFAGSKEYFVKAGAGSPENFLAYADFDNTKAGKKPLHYYKPHAGDYKSGDPTWKSGKGKSIIGALNYLAGKKMNSLYFLTMNVGGDGDDVFPWTTKSERYRFDVSKLDQWEIVFSHMEKLGIHMHVVTQEQETDQLLDGGSLGLQRKLYYRELIARFGHHLGLTWNLGEENTNTAAQRTAFADYINALDPYQHLIAVHTFPADRDKVYTPMIGHPVISGASLQLQSPSIVHDETLKWVKKSAASGQKWVVAVDELGHASVGAKPDSYDTSRTEIRHRVLWGSLLAGAGGLEWYFGYDYPHHDLTCEDWRTRDKLWTQTHYAAQFIRDYMPLPLVENFNGITSSSSDYCFGKKGSTYAIYLPGGVTTNITLPAGETYSVHWFNPRTGGSLKTGTVSTVKGGSAAAVGKPPSETSSDWVALLRRTGGSAPAPAPDQQQPTGMTVTKLTLVNADKQKDVRTLTNGGAIVFAEDGKALNVRADASGAVKSVVFYLNGKKFSTESTAPYAMAQDDSGKYRKWTPSTGTLSIRAVPYSGAGGTGAVGTPLEITVTVKDKGDVSQPAPSGGLTVTKLALINASKQQELRSLTNGAVIDLSNDGAGLNLRADVGSSAQSVVFYLNGKKFSTESAAPFALAGDDTGKYRVWKPSTGNYTLKVVPYSKSGGGGTAGTPLEIAFKVQN